MDALATDIGGLSVTKPFHGRSGQCQVPDDRYVENWYGPGKPGHVNSKLGYFLDHDLASADFVFLVNDQERDRSNGSPAAINFEDSLRMSSDGGTEPKGIEGKKDRYFPCRLVNGSSYDDNVTHCTSRSKSRHFAGYKYMNIHRSQALDRRGSVTRLQRQRTPGMCPTE